LGQHLMTNFIFSLVVRTGGIIVANYVSLPSSSAYRQLTEGHKHVSALRELIKGQTTCIPRVDAGTLEF
jgi:hypothetical protein